MEAERDLLQLLGGPSGLSLLVLVGFWWRTLHNDDRSPAQAWSMIAAEALSLVLCVAFVALSSARVFASWAATGSVETILVFLSIAWFVAIGTIVGVLVSVKRTCRYLVECYHPEETPQILRWLRRWVKS